MIGLLGGDPLMIVMLVVKVSVIKVRQGTAFATRTKKENPLAFRYHSRNAQRPVTRVAKPTVLY